MRVSITVCALILLVASCDRPARKTAGESTVRDSSTLIYHHGDILTMEGDTASYAEALVVKDGRILHAGSLEDARKLAGTGHRMVDLEGKTLLPGFIDAHGHIIQVGLQAASANLLPPPDGMGLNVDSIVEIGKRWFKEKEAAARKVGWIVGFGYDDAQLKERRHPSAADLDRVSEELPVLYIHQSGHLITLNHKGLELMGINASTPDPPGGVIRRGQDGKTPSGTLEEAATYGALFKMMGSLSQENQDDLFGLAQDLYARFGFTTAQEGAGSPDALATLKRAGAQGKIKLDVALYPMASFPDLMKSPHYGRTYQDHFRIAGQKVTLDGSPQGKTAWLTKPYKVAPAGLPKGYAGYPILKDQQVQDYVDSAFKNNWQILMHCNGDAAADQMIRAVAKATGRFGAADRRPVMIHSQTVRPDQLDSMKKYGIIPSFFGMHTFYWGDWHRDETLGRDRAYQISPAATALSKGIRFTQHHDAPVALPSSIMILHSVVNRVSRSGDVIGAAERLTPYQALLSITSWAAWQYFEENEKGTLRAGKLADLVILDRNPLKVDPMTIRDINVVETIKEGKTIYRK